MAVASVPAIAPVVAITPVPLVIAITAVTAAGVIAAASIAAIPLTAAVGALLLTISLEYRIVEKIWEYIEQSGLDFSIRVSVRIHSPPPAPVTPSVRRTRSEEH